MPRSSAPTVRPELVGGIARPMCSSNTPTKKTCHRHEVTAAHSPTKSKTPPDKNEAFHVERAVREEPSHQRVAAAQRLDVFMGSSIALRGAMAWDVAERRREHRRSATCPEVISPWSSSRTGLDFRSCAAAASKAIASKCARRSFPSG